MKVLKDQIRQKAKLLQVTIWAANKLLEIADRLHYDVGLSVDQTFGKVELVKYIKDYARYQDDGFLEYKFVSDAILAVNLQLEHLHSLELVVNLTIQNLGHQRRIMINEISLHVGSFPIKEPPKT